LLKTHSKNRKKTNELKYPFLFVKRVFLYEFFKSKNYLKKFKKTIDKIKKINIIIVTVIVIEVMTSGNNKIQPTA